MRSPLPILIAAGLLLFQALPAVAVDVKIIANESVQADSISMSDLRGVYLQEKRTLKGGSLVVPVLKKSGAVHEAFLRDYLNRDSQEIQTYYEGLTFSGKGSMPKELDSDEEMVAYVARTRGAIGYVSATAATPGVKVLRIESGKRDERILTNRVEPAYPETLKQLNIGGIVRLRITIAPKGTVEEVQLLGGNPILAEAAIEAVKQWVYSPAPTRTTTEVSIPFDQHR